MAAGSSQKKSRRIGEVRWQQLLCSLLASAGGREGILPRMRLGMVHLLVGQVGRDQKIGLGELGAATGSGRKDWGIGRL
jgi:hypothetical protein